MVVGVAEKKDELNGIPNTEVLSMVSFCKLSAENFNCGSYNNELIMIIESSSIPSTGEILLFSVNKLLTQFTVDGPPNELEIRKLLGVLFENKLFDIVGEVELKLNISPAVLL